MMKPDARENERKVNVRERVSFTFNDGENIKESGKTTIEVAMGHVNDGAVMRV